MTEQWLTKECAELLSNMMTCAEVKEAIKSAVLAEREACAKVCDEISYRQFEGDEIPWEVVDMCAAAIRARGEK